jgi:hypothetical protein
MSIERLRHIVAASPPLLLAILIAKLWLTGTLGYYVNDRTIWIVVLGGVLFATAILVAHAIAGTHAKVSLGGFPPLLIVIDAIFGMLLGALGGFIARNLRERHVPADKAA